MAAKVDASASVSSGGACVTSSCLGIVRKLGAKIGKSKNTRDVEKADRLDRVGDRGWGNSRNKVAGKKCCSRKDWPVIRDS